MDDTGWIPAIPLEQLRDGKGAHADVGGEDVLLVRVGDQVFALSNRCTHQGAPLHKGPVRTGSPQTVICPLHGSTFQLADGRVMRGPATAPLPTYEARVNGDTVEVRPAEMP